MIQHESALVRLLALVERLPRAVQAEERKRKPGRPKVHDDQVFVKAFPHTDEGAGVRSVFHKLRSVANENFNEQFKAIFGVHGAVPTKGLAATKRFALGVVLLYQLAAWVLL